MKQAVPHNLYTECTIQLHFHITYNKLSKGVNFKKLKFFFFKYVCQDYIPLRPSDRRINKNLRPPKKNEYSCPTHFHTNLQRKS